MSKTKVENATSTENVWRFTDTYTNTEAKPLSSKTSSLSVEQTDTYNFPSAKKLIIKEKCNVKLHGVYDTKFFIYGHERTTRFVLALQFKWNKILIAARKKFQISPWKK